MAGARHVEKGAAKAPPLDHQEQRALQRATEAVDRFASGVPRGVTAVAISEWIIARTSMSASNRLNADLLFDLGDARLRGFVEAALPYIAQALAHQGFDFNLPFGALSKQHVTDLFVAGILGAQEAAASANESLGFPFDDEIPFPVNTGPIADGECSH